METTLHRQLKTRFGCEGGGQTEVTQDGFRADALGPDGSWIEVQSGPLGPLRPKLQRLLPSRLVRVIKPIVIERRVVRRARRDGPDLSARRSPRRGDLVDAFEDLVGLVRVFPHPNLRIELLIVSIDEVRVPRRRWPGYTVADRQLREVYQTVTLIGADDLWGLLPAGLPEPFTTLDLGAKLDRSPALAQRVAYCLRLSGAARVVGKQGNRLIYARTPPPEAGGQSKSGGKRIDRARVRA